MEIGLYLLDTLLTTLLLYWCVTNSRRKPGTPVSGLFRYRDAADPAATPAPKRPGTAARR